MRGRNDTETECCALCCTHCTDLESKFPSTVPHQCSWCSRPRTMGAARTTCQTAQNTHQRCSNTLVRGTYRLGQSDVQHRSPSCGKLCERTGRPSAFTPWFRTRRGCCARLVTGPCPVGNRWINHQVLLLLTTVLAPWATDGWWCSEWFP